MCRFLFVIVLGLLAGCASVSVDQIRRPGEAVPAPQEIYVQEFDAPRRVFRVDRGARNLNQFRRNVARQLALATAERVNKRLVRAVALPRAAAFQRERAWLVTGRFVRVNQGSRALRTAFGFGLGGTKVETEVAVYDLSGPQPRPFLHFRTTGGSNAQPGVIVGLVNPNFYLMSLDTLAHLGPGLSFDVIRTSREVVAVLSEYMAQEGFIPRKEVSHAKKLGEWP
ncbi:MAG: DUF4410 domain-containing protein [Terrimicrobiaceae bacterium]|nr:DUF4410 domain-containing protein [Terrimicrobiaceae bacterium]